MEQYLLEQGFIPHVLQRIGKEVKEVIKYKYTISTMVDCWIYFRKEEEVYMYGLEERAYPPVLLAPRPWYIEKGILRKVMWTKTMLALQTTYSPKEIIHAVKYGRILKL